MIDSDDKLCICDCNTGIFITNISKAEIEYIYAIVVNESVRSGAFISDPLVKSTLENLEGIKDYIAASSEENRNL